MYRNSWLPEVFNDFFNTDNRMRTNATAPAINVLESENEYTVELAAPGMTKEDFNVNLNQDGDLNIKMEHKSDSNTEQAHYIRREFSYDTFEQTLILPDDVDKDKISASVADGVLTVRLPKQRAEQPTVSRQINIG